LSEEVQSGQNRQLSEHVQSGQKLSVGGENGQNDQNMSKWT